MKWYIVCEKKTKKKYFQKELHFSFYHSASECHGLTGKAVASATSA